ncbi:MAG: hypothetical protein FWH35_07175, partial [Treponema sp.]|nr:hypothetical protein [Treponema sp.]
MLPRGRSAELPLFADFSPEVLRFTDTGRIIGEFVIHYTFLGQERETIRAVTIATHSRNVITGSDTASLAAFVSPASAETLDFARFIAGLSRANRRTGHNNNMQYVIWLLEGLRASSIQAGQTYTSNDEAQYPAETLSYSTGTSRDLALLVAASLESVAIPSAFITVDGAEDFIVALNLGINQSAAETLFNGTGKILVINDEVWLPLSMNAFNEGFMACWTQGAAVINKAFKEDAYIDFILIQDAWAVYPPAPLPELGRNAVRTDNDAAINAVNRVMDAYIIAEINPLIQQMQGAANTAASQNRLGILYTRAGRIADGKAAYERAIGMGSVAAMTNRGNLALTEQDYAGAERWFRQALQREPDNRTALRGIERVQGAR